MVNIARNFLIMLNNLQQICLKLLQKELLKTTAEATDDLIGNEIADKIMEVSQNLQWNNLETVQNKHDKEIPIERYISPEERENYWCSEINIIV